MNDDLKEKYIDHLKRAMIMEELMVNVLIEFIQDSLQYKDIPKETIDFCAKTILGIKTDTLRHKEFVSNLLMQINKQ